MAVGTIARGSALTPKVMASAGRRKQIGTAFMSVKARRKHTDRPMGLKLRPGWRTRPNLLKLTPEMTRMIARRKFAK